MGTDDLLQATYEALLSAVGDLDDAAAWQPSRCAGWSARDLVWHLTADAQRALVAVHTPVTAAADVDAVSYWRSWTPGAPAAAGLLRNTRIVASVWPGIGPLADLYRETARAVLHAVRHVDPGARVATQGVVISVEDLASTLAVEATVHHLDLTLGRPSPAGLREVRRVLDGLLGRPAPIDDDARYALVGTGREHLTGSEETALGNDAGRFPLFG